MAKIPIHEVRQLQVPLATAVDAVLDLDSERGGALAFGPIIEACIETDPEPGLTVVVQRRGTGGTERRVFTLAIIAAALIRYCWKCRIPLPRHGTKRIETASDGFLFTIEGTIEVVRRHAALPPGVAEHPAAASAALRATASDPAAADASPSTTEDRQLETQEALEAVAG